MFPKQLLEIPEQWGWVYVTHYLETRLGMKRLPKSSPACPTGGMSWEAGRAAQEKQGAHPAVPLPH